MKKVLLFILICLPLCFFGCDKENLTKLSAPKNLVVENGVITFERVADEGYYSIDVNDFQILADINNSKVEIYKIDEINYFAYNAQNLLAAGEEYSIKVQAHAAGKKSSDIVSTTYLHHAKLETPTNLKIDGEILSWSIVENAENYLVDITAPDGQTSTQTSTRNLLDLSGLTLAGEYSFSVSAQTTKENFISSDAATIKFENFVTLDAPTNLSLENAENLILSAQIDERANAVFLKINGTQKIVEKQNANVQVEGGNWEFNLKNLASIFSGIDFENLGNYSVGLQAIFATSAKNYYLPSACSQTLNFEITKKLASPNVEIDSENFAIWSSSESEFIAGFKVEVDVGNRVLTYIFDSNILSLKLPENFVSVSVTALGKDFYLDSSSTTVRKN